MFIKIKLTIRNTNTRLKLKLPLRSIEKRTRKLGFIAIITLCGICLWSLNILSINSSSDRRTYEDTSCHYIKVNDSLPPAKGRDFRPPVKTIFFHETSCEGDLDSRQACSVESTARANPNWSIYVLFSAPVTNDSLRKRSIKVLQSFPNVKFFRIMIVDYAKGTPLESLVAEGVLNRSWYRVSHTSDVLRYLTLYKWGGVFMDLDVIVVKSFDTLPRNWGARENPVSVAAGSLAFSRDKIGRKVAGAAVREIRSTFRGDAWGHNGPGVITRVLKKLCSTHEVVSWHAGVCQGRYYLDAYTWGHNGPGAITRVLKKLCSTHEVVSWHAGVCQGFQVYGTKDFYPVQWENATSFFDDTYINVPEPYSYHFWNHKTHSFDVGEECPYVKLAKRYCPSIYEVYGDSFGS